jgi:class 3 adenylate cyclase
VPFITNLAGFDEKSSTTRHLFPCGRCGDVGFEGRSDYAAIGAVTNLASRLADEATGGQMLITQRLYAEIEDHVSVERRTTNRPLGPRLAAPVNVGWLHWRARRRAASSLRTTFRPGRRGR